MIQMYYLTNFKVFLHFLPKILLEIQPLSWDQDNPVFLDQSYPMNNTN